MSHSLLNRSFANAAPQLGRGGGPEAVNTVHSGQAAQRCRFLGILNVTPDSFSDGGLFVEEDLAVARGFELVRQGATAIDVGGESTRPGAPRVSAQIELARVIPVIRRLSAAGVMVSVDTTRALVAREAVEAGAKIINDVSGGLADPGMSEVVAELKVSYVVMHWRGPSDRMQQRADYGDVVADVRDALMRRAEDLVAEGVAADQIILDPGIGFAKLPHHNWALIRHLDTFISLGFPLLLGVSRKSFLNDLSHVESRLSNDELDLATALVTTWAAPKVAWLRVHDVQLNVRAAHINEILSVTANGH